MSVSSRRLSEDDDGDQTDCCRKVSTAECPQDRLSYFAKLQSLIKTSTQEVPVHQRQVRT